MATHGGPGRDRTADTAIFSRVLYQLSYRATGSGTLAGSFDPGERAGGG